MRPSTRRQQGTVLIETSLILVPVLFAAGLAVELLHSNQLRQVATLALYQTGRVASTSQALPENMLAAFRQAIAPLFSVQGQRDHAHVPTRSAEQRFYLQTGLPLWQLEILSPTQASFKDFADTTLTRAQGRPVIRNSYLAQQHQQHVAAGWPDGRGPFSGQTVFQANTLRLRLTLLYSSTVPGVRLIMKGLAWLVLRREDLVSRAWQQGLLAVVVEADVMMQSNVVSLDQYVYSPDNLKIGSRAQNRLEHRKAVPAVNLQPLNQSAVPFHPPTAGPAHPLTRSDIETAGTRSVEVENKKNPAAPDQALCDALLCCM